MNRRGFLAGLAGVGVVGAATLRWLPAPGVAGNARPCEGLADCPTRDHAEIDRVVWYEDARGDGGVALVPERRSASLPAFDVRFTLRNRSAEWVALNPYGWSLLKRGSGRWHHVAPLYRPLPLLELHPFGRRTWTLRGESEPPAPQENGTDNGDDSDGPAVGGLGGGTYAFTVAVDVDGSASSPSTLFAARLDVAGGSQTLSPSERVVDARRDGNTVVVETARDGGGEPATYVLERTPEVAVPERRRFLVEQVLRRWPLRDALAHAAPDVDEVRVLGRTRSGPPFAVADPPYDRLAYDGTAWTESAREGHHPG